MRLHDKFIIILSLMIPLVSDNVVPFLRKKSFNRTEIKLADQTTKTIKIQSKTKKCNKIYLVFENHSLPVSSA